MARQETRFFRDCVSSDLFSDDSKIATCCHLLLLVGNSKYSNGREFANKEDIKYNLSSRK